MTKGTNIECRDTAPLMAGRLDGILTMEEEARLDAHLEVCDSCRKEMEMMKKTRDIMSSMKFRDPEDEIWDKYWLSVYNRLERGIGWILLSIGMIMVVSFAIYNILQDAEMPLYMRIGSRILILGVVILLVSVIRERLTAYKHERYKEVKK
jgi:predicted anti-sigma-YlaC factor YlaD